MELHATATASAPPERSKRKTIATLLPIVGCAFLLRLVFVLLNYKDLATSSHFERFGAEMGWTARSLAMGHGFSSPFFPQTGPTALVPPLYPLLLSAIFRLFGVYSNASAFVALTLNSVFSSLTAVVIFFGMRRRFGIRTATGAAWLWALYPYAVYYSAVYLWDCALTSLLFACCFFLGTTRLSQLRLRGWAAYGALCGLAALSNPSIMTLLPVLMLYAAWQRWRLRGRVAKRLIYAVVAMAAMLSPWMVRNYLVFHEPVVMRDGFWGEFYAGNNGDTSHSNPGWTHPASSVAQMHRYQKLGETGYMAEKRQLSLQYIASHREQFVAVTIRRFVRYWTGYWSFSRHYLADESLDVPNVPFCTFLTAMMVVGLWQAWRRFRLAAIPYLAVFVLFPIPYYLTHASVDYRQPIEPLVVVAITYGAVWLFERYGSTAAVPESLLLSKAA